MNCRGKNLRAFFTTKVIEFSSNPVLCLGVVVYCMVVVRFLYDLVLSNELQEFFPLRRVHQVCVYKVKATWIRCRVGVLGCSRVC